jgi:alkylation response protein AidB-like acyl-CoA dehydrogenase
MPNLIILRHAVTAGPAEVPAGAFARIGSTFGMSGPDVASSDAANIATTLHSEGDAWMVSGRKC